MDIFWYYTKTSGGLLKASYNVEAETLSIFFNCTPLL